MTTISVKVFKQFRRGERDNVIHLLDLPEAGDQPSLVRTRCGKHFDPTTLAVIEVLTQGVACDGCLIVGRPPQPTPPLTRDPVSMPNQWRPSPASRPRELVQPGNLPTALEAVAGQPCVGFHEENLQHRIGDRPLAKNFQGQLVVITDCGRLGVVIAQQDLAGLEICADCRAPEVDPNAGRGREIEGGSSAES